MLLIRPKVFFTLLELLVVLFILSIGLGLTGIKIKDVYQQQRFLSEIEQVTNHLQTAQDIMLFMQTDVDVVFKRNSENKIQYKLVVAQATNPTWKKFIEATYTLKSIKDVTFSGQNLDSDQGIVLQFFSKGTPISMGKLVLSKNEKDSDLDAHQIVLKGYPHFIQNEKYSDSRPEDTSLDDLKRYSELYPTIILDEQKARVDEEVKKQNAIL